MKRVLESYIVHTNVCILDALKKINENGKKMVCVCNEENTFYGTITDGDVRRYLIQGGDLNTNIMKVVNQSPCVVYDGSNESIDYVEIMKEKEISAIPIINTEGKLIDVVSIYDDRENMEPINIPVAIMAGGKGTRLKPYTNILPKPLVPIGNKTIAERIIDKFVQNGCTQFHIIVNYKRELIKAYFSEIHEKYTLFFYDEHEYMGTGGGIKLLEKKIDETFILTNCDILINDVYKKYIDLHKTQKNLITVIGAKKSMQLEYGVIHVEDDGAIARLEEKPQYSFLTNTGFYIIEPEFFRIIPPNEFIHMPQLIKMCIEKGYRVGTYQIEEDKWLDMGQFEELEKMRRRYE